MLKRYSQFIKENKINELEFNEVILESDFADKGTSYSDLCKRNNDPQKDYAEAQAEMDSKGFTLDWIRNNFKGDSFVKFVDQHGLDAVNGYVDIYLYYTYEKLGLDKDLYKLGGHGWNEYVLEDDDLGDGQTEAVIRYSYGYHKTKYGILALEQAGLTVASFAKLALKSMENVIKEDLSEILSDLNVDGYALGNLKAEDFIIVEDDRIMIMTEDLKNLLREIDSETSSEELQEMFIRYLSKFGLDDFEKTNDILIVYSEFN